MEKSKTFEGKVCVKCNNVERYISDKRCVSCSIARNKNWKNQNTDKIIRARENYKDRAKEIGKLYHQNNKTKRNARTKDYYNQHKDELVAYHRNYYKANKDKKLEYRRLYCKLNPHLILANTVKRQCEKLKRIPKWLSKQDFQFMKEFYKNCPKGFHVDHIIPLQGKLICGLHAPNNLQYLTAKENLEKHNKFEPLFIKK